MDWQEKKAAAYSFLVNLGENLSKKVAISGEESPDLLRRKQHIRLRLGVGIAVVVASYAFGIFDSGGSQNQILTKNNKDQPSITSVAGLSTPLSPVKDGDIWVARIEKQFKSSQQELEKIRSENTLLEKRMDLLTKILGAGPEQQRNFLQEGNLQEFSPLGQDQQALFREGGKGAIVASPSSPLNLPSTTMAHPPSGPQKFPFPVVEREASANQMQNSLLKTDGKQQALPDGTYTPKKRKLLHLTHAGVSGNAYKSPETYLPSGTYFKVVTAMGVVVSTGTNSSSDPQPILLRIVDNGNLPGGLKGKVKNAVLIGTCYGSASAERAICRLKTLSWRDPSGRTIEKPVEGWIASEDGVQGIRAKMVDRSSEVVREAFGAGLLSAASNFLRFEASSSAYPMTAIGQTNPLSKTGALKGAVGTGAGSALDKLAEFSIKRAESMSPVAYVASGRVLDAVLMRGVDLSPLTPDNFHAMGSSPDQNSQPEGEKHDPS